MQSRFEPDLRGDAPRVPTASPGRPDEPEERTRGSAPATPEGPLAWLSVPDWSRERRRRFWDPSRQLLQSLRDYQRARTQGGLRGFFPAKLAVLRHRFWSMITGADIPLNTWSLGGGLMLPHPNGIVIHPQATIGPNCMIFQQVTIGTGPRPGVPRLGSNVNVGPGAKVLGGVVIGDHARIGANAVVINDVPAGTTAVGVPAVVKQRPKREESAAPLRALASLHSRPDRARGSTV